MSENVPESIPTSVSSRSNRPTKKRALGPSSAQSQQVEALFANPDREISWSASGKPRGLAAPPEIVANVQGSSAGAGSGEFHVYKASRRREYERQRLMEEETKEEEAEREFREKREKREQEDRERLEKNRAKREKIKARKGKKGKSGEPNGAGAGMEGVEQIGLKKKLGPQKVANGEKDEDGEPGAGEAVLEEAGITIHDDD